MLQNTQTKQQKLENEEKKSFIGSATGADAINISGLLNPKKLGNFNSQMLLKFF